MTATLDIDELEEIGIGVKFQDALCTMLESSYLFKDFSRQEVEQLVHHMHGYKVPTGTILFHEGESDSHLIVISSGKANISKTDGSGNVKEIAIVRKGATLGEMSIIDDFTHSATVTVIEDAEIVLITKANILNIINKYPALGVKLLWQLAWQLSARVRQASGKLVDYI